MTWLVLGLVLFLGAHSVRIVAEGWRTQMVERLGVNGWKGLYTVVSVAGFVLIVWGYGQARMAPVVLWPAVPVGVKHAVSLLTLVGAFVPLVFGLYWKRATTQGAVFSVVAGIGVWILFFPQVSGLGEAFPGQLAGLLAALGGMLAGSLLPQWLQNRHDGVHHVCHGHGHA